MVLLDRCGRVWGLYGGFSEGRVVRSHNYGMTCCGHAGADKNLNVSTAFLAPRLHILQCKLPFSTPLMSFEDSRDNSALAAPSAPSTAHPLTSPAHRPARPRKPSHPPGHAPSHIATTATTIPVTAIAAATAASEAPRADPFSPWDSDNAPPEVPEAQERFAGPCGRVWEVTAVAPWGGKGELTVLGSKGPIFFY